MLKTLLYVFVLAVLGFGVWYFLFSDKSNRAFNAADAGFSIQDTASIGKIFISENQNPNTILLERKKDGWVLNGKYPVLKSTLRHLMETMRAQQAMYPIPDNQRNDIIRSMVGSGIKTEVYDLEGHKMRSFYVGGELHHFLGTAMLMEGSERPYVVQIPGFDGYLTTRYSTDLNVWRDRLVFDYSPDQIASVSIHYPQEPLNSFTLTHKDDKVNVILDTALHYDKPLNVRRAQDYLGFFKHIYSEGYSTGMIDLDSIVRSMPEKGTIDITNTSGVHQVVRIIYFPVDQKSKNVGMTPHTFEDHFHTDRYFAILNQGADTMTVQIPTFAPIFRRGYEFFVPDETPQAKPQLPLGIRPSTH